MRFLRRLTWIGGFACALSLVGALHAAQADEPQAQTTETPGPLAGHSAHGEAFNEGPRQRAYLMGGTGHVHLQITSKSPEAQAFFDQGIGQLHGFWYYEAERSFRQVAALDPDCAMAYWGLAMANTNNEGRAKPFINQATERKAQASPREAMWIDYLAGYYADPNQDQKTRRRQMVRNLEAILHEYPDELEAKAFLIWQIWVNSSHDLQITSNQAVDALIDQVLAVEPMHPVHHYRIHLWDFEKPSRALGSAALGGQSAPNIAHMWHMPGHTYSNVQRYADAAWQQEASARVDHAYMMRDRILPDMIHNYAHNNEWLVRNLSFLGRVRDAIDLSKNLVELPRHPQYNTLQRGGSAQFGRTRLLELLQRYELWDELLALAQTPYLEPTDIFEEQIKQLRAVGVAWFGKGDLEQGKAVLASLEQTLAKEKAEQEMAGAQAEATARAANQPEDQVQMAKNNAINARAGRIAPVDAARAELSGLLALAGSQFPAAFEQFDKANGISKEFLARAWLQAGDQAKAEQFAREAVNEASHQVRPLANLVDILHRCGKTSEAATAFQPLPVMGAHCDLNVPCIQRLANVVREMGLPEDWRQPLATASDVGNRPPLDSLGPFRWQPGPAPLWSLPDGDGNPVSLQQYQGKPVILIFYLGYGCLHCVEQLKAAAPMAEQFSASGISIVAISSDSVADLRKSIEKSGLPNGMPFPLVSDQQLSAFKAYRAFDDFENAPLHATFLIDGQDRVRWQDIGFQPFTDFQFLLNESKRLLGLPL